MVSEVRSLKRLSVCVVVPQYLVFIFRIGIRSVKEEKVCPLSLFTAFSFDLCHSDRSISYSYVRF